MTADLLPCVEIEPRTKAERAVLWLHGLGADGHDFEPIVPDLGLDDLHVRFVFPHAPVIPVTINGGMRMRAWYDIRAMDLESRADDAGLRATAEHVTALVAREKARGIPARQIVLAGFSQGGAVAMHVALRYPERLAGLVALSTYNPSATSLETEASTANADLPVFQSHGTFDPVVPLAAGEAARDVLLARGLPVTWTTWPMQHQVCQEEIRDLAAFLRDCFAEPGS